MAKQVGLAQSKPGRRRGPEKVNLHRNWEFERLIHHGLL